ncbi:TonB-dependent receptor [Sinomicrobium kalidii]|uniref:TonB-dependent receptor n=1 Tax=Sinomicrobium kalidii TaxID=2900738 RepID=UPI001E331DFD|nr:TonB-dependent receptor [Sinomicrobium kalidii]UGU16352.1 TonB-dependent receptor [Sinomicrobium kalidii]
MKKNYRFKLFGRHFLSGSGKMPAKQMLRIMKIYVVLVCLTLGELLATNIKAQSISLNLKHSSLSEALAEIEQKTDYHFFYNNRLVDVSKKVSIDVDNAELETVLKQLLHNLEIDYKMVKNQIVLFPKGDTYVVQMIEEFLEDMEKDDPGKEQVQTVQHNKKPAELNRVLQNLVTGKVTDHTGMPLPGVNIVVKGTTVGTQTDFDGNYTIAADEGQVLIFSYVGQKTEEIRVGSSGTVNLRMEEDAQALEEVIVVAYGTTTKEAFTGAASVIEPEDIELRPATSPISAIEGAATGVQFTSASGQPGSSPNIVIRGVGTLNGSVDPLIIIDGIQFEGGLNSINQNDIESITILKDAASTSLYGSRAANGVVMITTKKGRRDSSLRVSANTQTGIITKGVDEYDAVSPGQYYELMWQAYKNSLNEANPEAEASATIFNRLGYNPFNVPNDEIVGEDGVLNPNAKVIFKGLDWYDVLERTGKRESHNVSVSGGGENFNVFFSASNLKETGYVIESDFQRTTTRLNASFSPKKWITLGGSVNLALSEANGPSYDELSSIVNPFSFAKNMASVYPIYIVDPGTGEYILDQEGELQFDRGEGYPNYGIQSRSYGSSVGRNAVEELILNSNQTKINNLGFRYNVDFNIIDGLKISFNYGQDIQDYIDKEYENNLVGDGAPDGRFSDFRYRRTVKNFNQIINYNKSFDDHNFEITLGHENFDREITDIDGFKTRQTVADIHEFDNFSVISSLDGSTTEKTLEGYFARLNYNFNNKYYLSGSVRRDGSSVFTNYKWGTFYSAGASWRIDRESFMDNAKFVNNLKLRASYGEVGNDRLDDDNYYISQGLFAIYPNAGTPGAFWDAAGNANLQWETMGMWDVALEFGFFNNRINGALEYYKKISSDLLYNVPTPISEGVSKAPDNIGDMYNEGFELGLNGVIVDGKDFSWEMGIQASTLKNEITFLPSPFITGSKRWEAGRSRYDFYIYDYAGVDPDNGDALFYMYESNPDDPNGANVPVMNEDGSHATTNDYQEANKGYVGESSVPDVIGSVRNGFSYKNINLNFLFVYQLGGKILDYGYADMMHEGDYGYSLHPDALKAWKKPGDVTDVPRMENGNADLSPRLSSRWLTDASYIALRNVNLSYNFGDKILDKLGMDKLRFFVSAENLALWAKRKGLNPQYNLSGTPAGNDFNPSRVASVGLDIAF